MFHMKQFSKTALRKANVSCETIFKKPNSGKQMFHVKQSCAARNVNDDFYALVAFLAPTFYCLSCLSED